MTLHKIFGFCLAVVLVSCAHAQSNAELRGQIRALGTTMKVLQVTAHPGDEDGALLLYEARGKGSQVTLLTLTRGERGENRNGILEPTEQALVRTMEQLSSDVQYGAEQRFTRVVDFGFARTADEVFDRWLGHNVALGDMVRVIRETRPEIIVTPFDTGSPDGDGQHEATAILVREAFRAAADAKKFPEQLVDGLEVWQAKRLFALVRKGGYSVALNAGEKGAGEHESWQQLEERAFAEQRSQAGEAHTKRETLRRYRLIDSAAGFAMPEGAKDFGDGLDSGLELLARAAGFAAAKRKEEPSSGLSMELSRLGSSLESDVDLFDDELKQVQSRLKAMSDAAAVAETSVGDQANCIAQLAEYLQNLRGVEDRILLGHPPAWLRTELETKRKQAEHALALAAGIRAEARLVSDAHDGAAYVLVPGTPFEVQVHANWSMGVSAKVASMELKPEGGRWMPRREWNPGEDHAAFRGRVPADAPFTRPQFLLEGAEDGAYRILDERNATRALPPLALQAAVEVEIAGEVVRVMVPVQARVSGQSADLPTMDIPGMKEGLRTVVVEPPMSVIVEPRIHWNRKTSFSYGEIEVKVRSNVGVLKDALLSVHPPTGWRAEPEHEVLDIEERGEEHSYRFYLVQERGGEGAVPVSAVVRWGGAVFDQGYSIVHGSGEQIAFDYRPSNGQLVSANVEVPENLEIGYVGTAGDAIPESLREINAGVTELDREELMNGRLGKYWAIVLGAHSVDTRDDLAEARTRLLRYAEEGGVVVMMAQSDAARFAKNAPLPYPVELGTARVSNEASAVELLDDKDAAFWDPNQIDSESFRGWTEERGRYFAQSWDAHFEALLRMNDPGQPVQDGALIRAHYGRGYIVYTGLSFYRQLPDGVPGAMRLLVNLCSMGAELHR